MTTARLLQDSQPQVLDILVQAESVNGSIVEQSFDIALVEAGVDFPLSVVLVMRRRALWTSFSQ